MATLAEKTKTLTLRSAGMLLLFVTVDLLVQIVSSLPVLLGYDTSQPEQVMSFVVYVAATSLALIIILPFFHAGLYGLTFLKINACATGAGRFFAIAKKTYGAFLKISIIIGLVLIAYWAIVPRVLTLIIAEPEARTAVISCGAAIVSLAAQLLFIFSYPLAIVGFFAGRNFKPLRASAALVVRHFGKIRTIPALLVASSLIGMAANALLPASLTAYRQISVAAVTAPITYVVLIYAYLLLTEEFFRDLQFDFQKA